MDITFLPITLNGPFDADERYAKDAGNIRLFGVTIDAKLGSDHTKGRNILINLEEEIYKNLDRKESGGTLDLSPFSFRRTAGDNPLR